jgi:nitroimidazol reductase NimA-like FMN-containing flavoprotein (pyridoxamine 5'-phosphate oxidase superfamily)
MEQPIPEAVEERLAGTPVPASLATCVDGRPHVAAVWYRYEDSVVEILTTGQKLANIRRNPRVALSIEVDDEGTPEWEATIRGTAHAIDDEVETREANRKLNRKYGVEDDAWAGENTLVRIDVGSASMQTW